MELQDFIASLTKRFSDSGNSIQTEEATKTALIMPMIQALGYDIFNPAEVIPEFTADIADKKGEKIDYAIISDGKPIMLIECKWSGSVLTEDNLTQLARYFMVVQARIGILTNGLVYEFYSDLDDHKVMDKKPFFRFDIRNTNETSIRELKKFSKSAFSLDKIIPAAEELKYTGEMKRYLLDTLNEPGEAFVRFIAKQVYEGQLTAKTVEKFSGITKKAFSQFVSERISDRLTSALQEEKESIRKSEPEMLEEDKPKSKIVTTQDEIDGFNIVRAILCQHVDISRIAYRDAAGHSSVLLDDNNRKPICRFYFNNPDNKQIGIFDENKKEIKMSIATTNDIYGCARILYKILGLYLDRKDKKDEQKSMEEQG